MNIYGSCLAYITVHLLLRSLNATYLFIDLDAPNIAIFCLIIARVQNSRLIDVLTAEKGSILLANRHTARSVKVEVWGADVGTSSVQQILVFKEFLQKSVQHRNDRWL